MKASRGNRPPGVVLTRWGYTPCTSLRSLTWGNRKGNLLRRLGGRRQEEVGRTELVVRRLGGRTQAGGGWVGAGDTSGGGYIFNSPTLTSESESTWGYSYTLTDNPRRWVASVSKGSAAGYFSYKGGGHEPPTDWKRCNFAVGSRHFRACAVCPTSDFLFQAYL